MEIETAIKYANERLKYYKIKSFQLDSEILMSKILKRDRKFILLNEKTKLDKAELNNFRNLIKQRSKGKPVAYLTGKKYFWKNEFLLNEDVLIPRPDTELVVEQVLKISKYKSKLNILDIGVGSGCILLSILKEKRDFYGTGLDINKNCIKICEINALNLKITNKLKLFKTDIDNFTYGKYDLIISNPPYIKKLDLKYLEKDIINFEPKLALDGGLEGISEIRKIINKSSELIKKNGKLILEIAFDQKNRVSRLLRNKGFYINKVFKDYAKNDRCIVSTKI